MPIYCDESGGVGAGVLTLAAARLSHDQAEAILAHYRDVTGLRGELKGSRIAVPERAFLLECFARHGGQAIVGIARSADVTQSNGGKPPEDLRVYAYLLDTVVDAWMDRDDSDKSVIIDDGRYDDRLNGLVRAHIERGLGAGGQAALIDSRRSAGVQIADVIANTLYNVINATVRGNRIHASINPFMDMGVVRLIEVKSVFDTPVTV